VWPDLKVSIAFVSDPLATSPTWVDVSAYVRLADGVTIRRGGSGDPDQPDHAGFLGLTLSNRDRRFDPYHSTGPYYGYLTPKRQIKVEAVWATVTYPMFYGWVTGFPNKGRAMGKDAVCEIEAYDAIGALAGVALTSDLVADYVESIAASTYIWYRYFDPSSVPDSGTSGVLTSRFNGIAPVALVPESGVAVGLSGNSWAANRAGYVDITPPCLFGVGYDWTLSFWIQTTTSGSDYTTDATLISGGPTESTIGPVFFFEAGAFTSSTLTILDNGTLKFRSIVDRSGTDDEVTIATTRPINDGFVHHIAIVVDGGVSETVYIDGIVAESTSAVVSGNRYPSLTMARLGAPSGTLAAADILASTTLQDVLVMTTALSATQVAAIHDLGVGIATESTATRAGRLLDELSWPSAWRDISSSTVGTCGPLNWNGQSVLAGLQEVERTEQGRLYAANDGKVTLRQRYYAYEDSQSSTVQVTFSDDGSNEHYRSFGHGRGDIDVVNDATVSNGQIEARSTDSTSQTTYGPNANTYNTVLSTYAQVRDMAAGIIFLRKDAATRLEPIQVGYPSSWADVLGMELADRVRVESTPMGVGSQLTADVLVESIQWNVSQAWRLTFAGNPVPPDPATVGFWVLGTSELDTSTVLAF